MGNLTTSDMIIVITLVSIILVLVIIIVILDILNKRNKKEELEIDKAFGDDKMDLSRIELPSSNTPSRVEEIKYVEEDEELEKTKAKLELLALKEELERQKEQDNLSPLAESVEEDISVSEPEYLFDPNEKIKISTPAVEPAVVDEPKEEEIEIIGEEEPIVEVEQQKDIPTPEVVEVEPVEENTPEVIKVEPVVEEVPTPEVVEVKEETPVEEPAKPIKYNFDKMVESVKLDNEEDLKPRPILEDDDEELRAYPVEARKFELPIDEIDNVEIQEAHEVTEEQVVEEEEEKENLIDRIIKEEELAEEKTEPAHIIKEFGPVNVERIEVISEDEKTDVVPDESISEVEIQEVQEEKEEEPVVEEVAEEKPIEVEQIVSSINEDLKEVEPANLSKINEMQEDLNEILNSNKESEVTLHEDKQEENAIISVEELSKLSDEVYDNNENYQMSYEDEGNEPISIKELEQLYNTTDLREVTEVIKKEPEIVKEEIKMPTIEFKRTEDLPPISSEIKFKSTPFISPVFGVTETPSSLELEQTANLDKLNDEIKKTNEFLNKLRELQKNLD